MACSKYQSTMETTYFARKARVIMGPCTDIMRDVLKKNITPLDLSKEVIKFSEQQSKKRTEQKERKKNPFTKDQLQLINGGNYSNFDITLLCSLLRNICQITPHVNGWGNDPSPSDRSVSANIERIRLKRNEHVHSSKPYITEKEFKKTFQEISQIVQELEHYLGTTSKYHDTVQEIETCTMDPNESKKYIEKLLNINKNLHDISEEVRQIREIKTAAVPPNLKDYYMLEIVRWKNQDNFFVETHSFSTMFQQVKNQPYVTIVGAPGSGKSATAHHIALKLHNEDGYDILPIRDIKDIETYCDIYNPQVFVIDDVLGMFGLDMKKFNLLQTYKDRFTLAAESKTKILMTCRATVFKTETLLKYFLTEETNVIQLHSTHNKLTDEDKRSLLAKYKLSRSLIPPQKMSETSAMFPYLCKMFSELKFNVHGYRFFITPIKYYKDALDEMQTRNKMHYVSLVLLMLHQNKLSETDLERAHTERKPIDIKDVFKKCKVNSHTDSFEIADALKEMVGTYTQTCDDQFCFIHDSMFEIVACQFGCQFPELILKNMSSEYIANYIGVSTNDGEINENESVEMLENIEHLSITLKESQLPMFAERLFIDLKDGETIGILKNMKHPSVMQAFQKLIKEKQYDELLTAFFGNQCDKNQHLSYTYYRLSISHRGLSNDTLSLHYLLYRGMINSDENSRCERAIRYFVAWGQHGILQHIIDKMMTQKGNINDLFQTFCNKEQQSGQGVNEDDTGAEVERTEDDDTTVETTTTKNKIQKKSTLCFKNSDTDKEIVNNDHTRTGYKDSESDNKSDIDIYSEDMIFEQWRLLCLGCHSGDVNTVKILLKYVNTAALNMHFKIHCTNTYPLTVAYTNRFFDIAKELIKAGANVNTEINDEYERSLLSKSCSSCKGHWDIAKELIKAGADVNKGKAFGTALIDACKNNNLNALRLLIKAGANLNLKTTNKTPLQISYDAKSLRTADELIKAGANANSENGVQSSTTASCNGKSVNIEKRNNADIDNNPNKKKHLQNIKHH